MDYSYPVTGYTGQGSDMMGAIGLGLSNAINNYLNVKGARQDLDQRRENFNIDSKIKKLELQKLEGTVDADAMRMASDIYKKQLKAANAQYDLLEGIQDAAAKGEKDKIQSLMTQAKIMSTVLGGSGMDIPNSPFKNSAAVQRESRMNKQNDFANTTKIREEFLNRPEVKDYVSVSTQVNSMDSLLKKAKEGNIQNRVALDQGLVTMFNKLTDPQSVVRESEYARTPENLPLLNRFSGALDKIQKGGAGLTDKDRESLVWGAKVIANERGKTYNDTYQGYQDMAGKYGMDYSMITRGLGPHTDYELGSASDGSDSKYSFNSLEEAEKANLPSGTVITVNGRRAKVN